MSIASATSSSKLGEPALVGTPFDPQKVRADFPILSTQSNGKPLVYLDNGATTQKPRAVIDAEKKYYEQQNANIHRGVYALSQEATALYDAARHKIQNFIGTPDVREVIFTRGTTEGINLVAQSYARTNLKPRDEILITAMEHHSNIVPWQMVCEQTGAKLKVAPINDAGELIYEEFEKLLSDRTKIVAAVHLSNSLGTINPVKKMIAAAHAKGAVVLIDGAQWVAHHKTDVRDLDADFYVFSGHKLFGPTGIGVLYGKLKLLEAMPPYQGGGDMIESVTFEKTLYAELPNKFEAGTPNIAGAIGLGAAIDYVQSVGFEKFLPHEQQLLDYATQQFQQIAGVRIVGTAKEKGSLISFVIENPPISSIDIGLALDREGVAVRTGHHCCQPLMDRMNITATSRASFAMYNTKGDVDVLIAAVKKVIATAGSKAQSSQQSSKQEVEYPKAFAKSPQLVADQLANDFEELGEREARNEYVLEMGARLPHTFNLLKLATQRVPGCMSEVYLVARKSPEASDRLEFVADANAEIVRGLIAILQKLFSGQRAADILKFDTDAFFNRIGLDQFISSQRRNGLAGMVAKIRAAAQSLNGESK